MKNREAAYSAFTLIEGLISLMVTALLIFFMKGFVITSVKISTYQAKKCALEWHLFISQLENNAQEWELQSLESQKLVFINRQEQPATPGKDQTFELTPYKNQLKIKKRGGYEPLLTKVVSSHFSTSEQGVSISVVMEDGKSYEGVFSQWQKE